MWNLRGYLGLRGRKKQEAGENFILRSCMIYCLHQILPRSRGDPGLVGLDII